jgi:hypothetical protein
MTPEQHPGNTNQFVHGVARKVLIFIPRENALELAALREALKSPTWGELKSRLSREQFLEVFEIAGCDDLPSFDEFYADERKADPALSREAAQQAYRALSPDERQPEDDDPFDVGDIGPFCDGDWPAWPEQEMLRSLPKDIQLEFGTVVDSVHNGEFLVLDAARETEIVAALRQRGHRCTKDDDLVRRACGK